MARRLGRGFGRPWQSAVCQAPTLLRLEAPFGPLQEKAIDAIWTISISPLETGSSVTFEFIANGSAFSKLDELAPAVEMVKTQALKTLVQPIANEVSK